MLNRQKDIEERYHILSKYLESKNIEIERVKKKLSEFSVEVPSWVFGRFGGGRFSGYMPPGAARTIFEKFDDAAMVNNLTGSTPKVSIHVGWDSPEKASFCEINAGSFKRLEDYAKTVNVGIGSVNPTYFLEGTHFGSLSANDPSTRNKFVEHTLVSAEVAEKYGTCTLNLWFPDGSLYPGQVCMWQAEENLYKSLKTIYDRMPSSITILLEYKLFEPGTYHTVVSDVSVASEIARNLGDRSGILIDLGHHPHGVNVEHIVARLVRSKRPGGIHFNSRYAADDDQAVEPGAVLFRIFHELVLGDVIGDISTRKSWIYMVDQCSRLENRMQAVLHTIDSLMISYAKALIVDQTRLEKTQKKNEIILANRILLDAFLTDVRPIIQMVRSEKNLPLDPIDAYIRSGYQEKIETERK